MGILKILGIIVLVFISILLIAFIVGFIQEMIKPTSKGPDGDNVINPNTEKSISEAPKEPDVSEEPLEPYDPEEPKKSTMKDKRVILMHEIWTKVDFKFENNDGEYMEVFGQDHRLCSVTQTWDEENEEWNDDDSEIIDDFYLTGYEEGFRFSEDNLCNFFQIDELPECNCNGWDSTKITQKKWDAYKQKFPEASSVTQFEILN